MKNLKNILILLRLVSTREHPVYEGKQTRINPYNPLSYISLFLVLLFVFIKEGLTGLKEVNNPFKWIPYYKNDNADDLNDKKPSKFKKLLGVFIKTIDWKWVGLSYVFLTLIFGVCSIIENDFIALIYGFLSFTIFISFVFLSIFF
jgi:hypothetical protein